MTQHKPRSDGIATRQRLLLVATRLFARDGYSGTTTRAIVQAAAANVGAISYYFGNKQGLYQAVVARTDITASDCGPPADDDMLSLRHALRDFYLDQLRPAGAYAWSQDDLQLANTAFRTRHLALVKMLCSALAMHAADEELHRLAICMAGLASPLLVSLQAIADIAPALLDSVHALERWAEYLAGNAEAMLAAEAARRQAPTRPW
jgi:AcrR family transcriptional regulator